MGYATDRLVELIREGEAVLKGHDEVGNMVKYDLWQRRASAFLAVVAREHLGKFQALRDRYSGGPVENPYGRWAYDFINEHLEVLKFANGHLSEPQTSETRRKIAGSMAAFLSDNANQCTDYDKNVFLMMPFKAGDRQLDLIERKIRRTLKDNGLIGHRADDRCYPLDQNLWDNVCTYMHCCKYGIALLEDLTTKEFNPNVALEYGYMRALEKPTLLLKEKRFQMRADILGTIWQEFDLLMLSEEINSGGEIEKAVKTWVDDVLMPGAATGTASPGIR